MNIYLTRHGQTRLNKDHRMQGLTDEPLNETGIQQAEEARKKLMVEHPGLSFDAVYASPLVRAQKTACIIGGVSPEELIIDERIIEVDFGKYEQKKYNQMGPWMTLYWILPELIPAPPTVETTDQMVARSRSFLEDLSKKDYENVLIACHGGIIRALSGCLEGLPRGYRWRPKPKNCEIRIYNL